MWAQTPAPEPEGPTQYLPYGDDARTTQFVGVDDLVTGAGEEYHEPDAFAHLFRDQGQGGGRPPMDAPAVPGPSPAPHSGQAPVAPSPAPMSDATMQLTPTAPHPRPLPRRVGGPPVC